MGTGGWTGVCGWDVGMWVFNKQMRFNDRVRGEGEGQGGGLRGVCGMCNR